MSPVYPVAQFHFAVNMTDSSDVARKFLKLVAVVDLMDVSVVVAVPYVCVTESMPVIFHPANVACSCVGLSTVNATSYVADVG